jgi:hypothetical protein
MKISGKPKPPRLQARPDLFGRERHVMRPFMLKIAASGFAFAAGHRHIATRSVAGWLNCPFSMASLLSAVFTVPISMPTNLLEGRAAAGTARRASRPLVWKSGREQFGPDHARQSV